MEVAVSGIILMEQKLRNKLNKKAIFMIAFLLFFTKQIKHLVAM